MSFTLTIRPGSARLASRAAQLGKTPASAANSGPSAACRAFHRSAPKNSFFTGRTAALLPKPSSFGGRTTGLVSRLLGASRGYQSQVPPYGAPPADQGTIVRKLLVGGAIFGGTLVAINVVFNRETRDDGGMPVYEREYLNNTFLHTGLGIGIIGLTARQMVRSGFVFRLMVTNPWAVAIGGLALGFGTMIGTRSIDPDKYVSARSLVRVASWVGLMTCAAIFPSTRSGLPSTPRRPPSSLPFSYSPRFRFLPAPVSTRWP